MPGSWEDQVNEGYGNHVQESWNSGMGGSVDTSGDYSSDWYDSQQAELDSMPGTFLSDNWESITAVVSGILTAVSLGTLAPGIAAALLVKKGLNSDLVQNALSDVSQRVTLDQFGNTGSNADEVNHWTETLAAQYERESDQSGTGEGTIGGGQNTDGPESNDPTSVNYWEYFTERFLGGNDVPSYEEMVLSHADFQRQSAQDLSNTLNEINTQRNNAVTQAVGSFDSQINGLLDQANSQSGIYKPVGFSFGDFSHSWTPSQSLDLGDHITGMAQDQLNANLGLADFVGQNDEREALTNYSLTDALSPQSGNLSFMDALKQLGLFQAQLDNNISIADIQNQEHEATDLEVISELINTADSALDLFNRE